MNNETYYQPVTYYDDGTNISLGNIPDGMFSFHVFHSVEECTDWLRDNGYNPEDYAIIEYHDDDIEEHEYIEYDGF